MPRLDHRLQAAQILRPGDALLIALLLDEINTLREALHLPARTMQDLHTTLCTSVQTHAAQRRQERSL